LFASSIPGLTIASPPDYANRKWYDSQSSRVYDAIDVAHLLAAQDGYDSMSKMQIWDVSQNVDRFKTGMGLMPCITPGGCDFASNRQDALNGSQTLVLQGMPLDKLHFAGETQRECQDLAGNAMSTTVIGASLISAIIHGHKAFRTDSCADAPDEDSQQKALVQNRLLRASVMMDHRSRPTNPEHLSIEQLLAEAVSTSRLCACEGEQQISESVIKTCSECGHTACSLCASNPRHRYVKSIARDHRKQVPAEFVRSLRTHLPSRLQLQNFPNLEDEDHTSESPDENNRNDDHVKRIVEAELDSRQFTLGRFIRCDKSWKIVYASDDVRLELSLGDKAQWLLFVDSPPDLPSNSELRKSLKTPITRGAVKGSLLDIDWEIFVPSYQEHSLRLHGSTERSKSWRNQLGLPDFQSETVPSQIHLRGEGEDTSMLDGDYTHLPHCGTAEASLYKRDAEPVLYLFLDPDPIGEARNDRFVFSRDCNRKRWGESRTIVAHLDPAWRPWQMGDEDRQHIVEAMPTGLWHFYSMQLSTSQLTLTAQVLSPETPLTKVQDECTNAVTVLDVSVPEQLPIEQFGDFSWALEPVKTAPLLNDWQSINIPTQSNCLCSPAYPKLLWSVDNGGRATPHEDRRAAATFERGVKSRCPIFHEQSSVTTNATRIGIGINFFSLAHRAKGRLARSMGCAKNSNVAWRLLTDHADAEVLRFPKYYLRSNATDAPFSGPLGLEHDLRGAQPRALAWMHNQEAGVPLTVTEIEEAIHQGLGWRAEARAERTVDVRGGVLADLPSFGKTVTSIALIQSEFEELSPEAILENNRSVAEHLPQLIDTAATLIVCPPHIAMQWQTELELFLGDKQYQEYNICVIRDFAELKRLTVDDLQRSRVIVVSWTVLSDDEYISELAWVTAMPEPANSSCRAFDAWMDGVSEDLPSQVLFLQSTNLSDFEKATQGLLDERLQQPEFQATLPVRLQHGSNYQPYQTVRAANGQKKSVKYKPSSKRKSSGSNGKVVPLLHMFRFNRLVVDEYHYLNDYKKIKNMFTAVSVKKVAAHKRWILSGTPALANFADIDNIASFLGVRLGRFAVRSSKLTPLEEFLVNDQTAVERFLSKTEVMSQAWHRARHDRAQEFLDKFVRQNEASLKHIPCLEELRAVDLDIAHHAVYLELSQHLSSQRMQVKRLRNKGESDRVSRLNASLNNSKTAEDALLKAALLYETSAGESGLDSLVRKRSEQRDETEREISRLMRAFEWHKRTGFKGLKPADPKKVEREENTVPKLWASFTQDIKKHAWLGDYDATTKAKLLLSKAEAGPTPGGLEELKEASKENMIKEAKTIMSHLRDSCVELALRTRSERFISNVKELLQPLCEDSSEPISCDAERCPKTATISEMYLASQCGHLTCRPCVLARGDNENCTVTGCSCTVQAVSLIKATNLGSTPEKVNGHSFGRKMDGIARLIRKLPDDDQALVFAPNDETVAMLGEMLEHHNILYCMPSGNSRQTAKIIEEFKASVHEDPETRPKVLLLNSASETAAGV
jgi:SNF2 family DNA or RNA helicase